MDERDRNPNIGSAVITPFDLEPALQSARHGGPRSRLGVVTDEFRARRGTGGVRGKPRRVAHEDQLPGGEADDEQRRHNTEQLDRRLSALPQHATTVPTEA